MAQLTLNQAKKLRRGQTVYIPGLYNVDGTAQRWKVSGKVETWVRDPGRVKIPIQRGFHRGMYITEWNLHEFTLKEPARQKGSRPKKKVRK